MIFIGEIISCNSNTIANNNGKEHANTNFTQASHSKKIKIDEFDKQVLRNNNKGILKIDFDNDTLHIVSDKDLTYEPFGTESSPDSIIRKFPSIFSFRKLNSKGSGLGEKADYALIGKSSHIYLSKITKEEIKEFNGLTDSIMVYKASIKDNISMAYGIKVGMSKDDFLTIILGKHDADLFSKISVVVNGDAAGEILTTYFIFKNEILSEVKMTTPLL